MKQMLAIFFAMLLLPFSSEKKVNSSVLRAMLIGSDHFITQENTYPIAGNNLNTLHTLLQSDYRQYQDVVVCYETIATPEMLAENMQHFFAGCDNNDISLFYLSTHGTVTDEACGLYLSNGTQETILPPQTLADLLSAIPGKKILLLDACNSGAFISKGTDNLETSHPFTGKDIYVITSAGACEASWQWQSNLHSTSGGSYFAALLSGGLSGYHAADTNRDLTVTINEAYAYIRENIAASTPQRYPENTADFPLYCYSPSESNALPPMSGLVFEDTLLSADQSDVHFSFTIHRETQLYYQLVYYKDGKWDFENAAFFHDTQEGDGPLSPGRKQRNLQLNTQNRDDSGYVMIQLFSVEADVPVFLGGRLLCIQPARGAVQLQVATADGFDPLFGEEMSILVSHDVPCALSVSVRDASGKVVRRLSYSLPTRPLQLSAPATVFYWDGTDNQGMMAPLGKYYIHVQASIGDNRFTAESAPFILDTIIEN